MVSGRIKGFWRRVRNRHLFVQGNPSYADPSMDTPERAAEKRQDPAGGRPGYPGGGGLPAPGRVAGCTDLPPRPGGARFYDQLWLGP